MRGSVLFQTNAAPAAPIAAECANTAGPHANKKALQTAHVVIFPIEDRILGGHFEVFMEPAGVEGGGASGPRRGPVKREDSDPIALLCLVP